MNNGNQPVSALNNTTRADIIQGELIGLTKREHFAGLAMQGILASDIKKEMSLKNIYEWSVKNADALLKELEK